MFDLDRYLERIGLAGRPSIAEVHLAHSTSIPFENFDSRRGVEVSLAAEDLLDKLVSKRRGGYCFEQNLLLTVACSFNVNVNVVPTGGLRLRAKRIHRDPE